MTEVTAKCHLEAKLLSSQLKDSSPQEHHAQP